MRRLVLSCTALASTKLSGCCMYCYPPHLAHYIGHAESVVHFLFVFGLQWLMRCFNVHVPACYCSATLVFLFLPLKSICYCCWRIDSFNFLLLTCLSLRPRDVVFITVALFQGKCPSLEISVWGLVCIEQTRMAVCLSWRKRGPIYPEQLAGMEFNSFGLPGCAAEVAGVTISDSNSCSKVLESRLKPF